MSRKKGPRMRSQVRPKYAATWPKPTIQNTLLPITALTVSHTDEIGCFAPFLSGRRDRAAEGGSFGTT